MLNIGMYSAMTAAPTAPPMTAISERLDQATSGRRPIASTSLVVRSSPTFSSIVSTCARLLADREHLHDHRREDRVCLAERLRHRLALRTLDFDIV